MEFQIDYLRNAEQVYITNDSPGNKLWRSFYAFICDYIPTSIVTYSEWGISFPWRYFIAIKGNIGYFIQAHIEQLSVKYTNTVRMMLIIANDNSYSHSISLAHFAESEIQEKLV